MKKYGVEAIRNIGLFGHQGSGKTSLAEAMLFASGGIDRMGRTDDGTSTLDFDPEEVRRNISINIGLAPCEWNGCKINVVDVPGYLDFENEVRSAMRVVDAAVLVTPAQGDLEVGFEIAWDQAIASGKPRAVLVNKMDRENADYFSVVEKLRSTYGTSIAPVHVPIGQADSFSGVVDLVHMKAYTGVGKEFKEIPIPAELEGVVSEYREKLIESAAEGDDAGAVNLRQADEHHADRSQADHSHGVAWADAGLFDSSQDASQRLDEGGFFVIDVGRDFVSVLFDDAGRNAYVFSVSAVVEQQVLTQVGEVFPAKETLAARSGVGSHDSLADTELANTLAHLDDVAGEFVSKQSRRNDHPGVVSSAEHLHVRAASERGADPHENVAFANFRNSNRLYAKVLLPVKHSRDHLGIHSDHLCGSTTIFNDCSSGCNAKSNPDIIRSKGNRWETSSPTGNAPLNTRSADSFCKSIEAL